MTREHEREPAPDRHRDPKASSRDVAVGRDHSALAVGSAGVGHIGTALVGQLLPPSLWYRERAERLPELLAQVDPLPGADNTTIAVEIAENEALRRHLGDLLEMPVSLDREPRSLPAGQVPRVLASFFGVELPLDSHGNLSLA